MTEKAGVEYGYEDGAHVHAVTDLDGVRKFQYDDYGNMISRVDGTTTYEQSFDVENRLVVVTNTNTLSITQFAYDAGGLRVKTVGPDGTIIYTPFPNYEEEVAPGVATIGRSFDLLNGAAVAFRITGTPSTSEDGLYFIHTDHLGSTSLLSGQNGDPVGDRVRYYPYGEYRNTPTVELVDRGYTDHLLAC